MRSYFCCELLEVQWNWNWSVVWVLVSNCSVNCQPIVFLYFVLILVANCHMSNGQNTQSINPNFGGLQVSCQKRTKLTSIRSRWRFKICRKKHPPPFHPQEIVVAFPFGFFAILVNFWGWKNFTANPSSPSVKCEKHDEMMKCSLLHFNGSWSFLRPHWAACLPALFCEKSHSLHRAIYVSMWWDAFFAPPLCVLSQLWWLLPTTRLGKQEALSNQCTLKRAFAPVCDVRKKNARIGVFTPIQRSLTQLLFVWVQFQRAKPCSNHNSRPIILGACFCRLPVCARGEHLRRRLHALQAARHGLRHRVVRGGQAVSGAPHRYVPCHTVPNQSIL